MDILKKKPINKQINKKFIAHPTAPKKGKIKEWPLDG
jgi:hypothetical protein